MLMLFPQRVLLQLKTNVKRGASCCSDEEELEDLAVQSFYHCFLHLGARHSNASYVGTKTGYTWTNWSLACWQCMTQTTVRTLTVYMMVLGVYFILCNANRKISLRRWWSWVGCLRVKYLRQLAWPGIEGNLSFPIRWFVIFYVVL